MAVERVCQVAQVAPVVRDWTVPALVCLRNPADSLLIGSRPDEQHSRAMVQPRRESIRNRYWNRSTLRWERYSAVLAWQRPQAQIVIGIVENNVRVCASVPKGVDRGSS